MIAKDFQEATAMRIVDLFTSGHKRVLLADEVGLGKTIVAKTVVEKLGELCQANGDDYVVVYICSNAGIADQNCSKLGIDNEHQVRVSEGRLSMQHLKFEEMKQKGNVRLIPMTPATSLQMRSGVGTADERALAYLIMHKIRICGTYSEELSLFLRTPFIESEEFWRGYIDQQNMRIEKLSDKRTYLKEMKQRVNEVFTPEFISEIKFVCKEIRKNFKKVKKTARMDRIISWEQQGT